MIRHANSADASAIVYINHQTWRSAYQKILPSTVFDQRDQTIPDKIERLTKQLKEKSAHMLVAEFEDRLVGFVSYGASRSDHADGEIYAIYLLDSHQRHGLGRQLFLAAAQALNDMGFKDCIVWCLSDNPSYSFYKSFSERNLITGSVTIGEVSYPESGFVYSLSALCYNNKQNK